MQGRAKENVQPPGGVEEESTVSEPFEKHKSTASGKRGGRQKDD